MDEGGIAMIDGAPSEEAVILEELADRILEVFQKRFGADPALSEAVRHVTEQFKDELGHPTRDCPDCKGRGFTGVWSGATLGPEEVPCARCGGSGQVPATDTRDPQGFLTVRGLIAELRECDQDATVVDDDGMGIDHVDEQPDERGKVVWLRF